MNKEIKRKLYQSLKIIKSCTGFLFMCLLICILRFSSGFSESGAFVSLSYLSYIIHFIFIPIAYGRFIEIINNDEHISYSYIFKKHWVNYYLVLLIFIASLSFLLVVISQLLPPNNQSFVASYIVNIAVVTISIITIFVLPLVFFMEKRLQPILLGIKCVIGNPRDSTYLIILVLVMFGVNLFYSNFVDFIGIANVFIHVLFGILIGLLHMILNFTVFVTASLILKEKLLNV